MRGCPWKITKDDILDFFESSFGNINEEDIHIEQFNGRRTGTCMVIFDSNENAQKAKS